MNMPPSAPNNEPWKPKIERIYKKREKEPGDDEFVFELYKTGDGNPPEFETTTGQDSLPPAYTVYETLDGNKRFLHYAYGNTKQEGNIQYMICATESPFTDSAEIKLKTPVPERLTETDFFTNYINSKLPIGPILVDPNTGNEYFDFSQRPDITGVPFGGDYHWNVQRFLIQPHFNTFDVPKDQARQNALHDIFKYFLYIEQGNRETAWAKANRFVETEVDPIVNSKYAKWAEENYKKLNWRPGRSDFRYVNADHVLYDNDNETELPRVVLDYNSDIFSGAASGTPYTRREIEEILTDYNIHYRKKDAETAQQVAKASIDTIVNEYRLQEEYYRNRPITEARLLVTPQYPEGFENWIIELQQSWKIENPNKLGKFQEEFTEDMRQRELARLRNFRFADE